MAGRNRDGEGQDHQGDLLQSYVPDTPRPAVEAANGQKILSGIDEIKEILAARGDAEPAPPAVNSETLDSILQALEELRTAQEKTSAALDPEAPNNIPAAIAGLRAVLEKPEPETEPAFVKPLISTLENNSAVLKSTRTDLDAVMEQSKTSTAAIQDFQEHLDELDDELGSAPSLKELNGWRDSFMMRLGEKLAEARITGREATGRDPESPDILNRLDNSLRELKTELSRVPSAGTAALPATQDAARAVAVYDTVSIKVTTLGEKFDGGGQNTREFRCRGPGTGRENRRQGGIARKEGRELPEVHPGTHPRNPGRDRQTPFHMACLSLPLGDRGSLPRDAGREHAPPHRQTVVGRMSLPPETAATAHRRGMAGLQAG